MHPFLQRTGQIDILGEMDKLSNQKTTFSFLIQLYRLTLKSTAVSTTFDLIFVQKSRNRRASKNQTLLNPLPINFNFNDPERESY